MATATTEPRLKPEPEKVKEYTHYICVNWDRLYGRRRHEGDDGGDEAPEMEVSVAHSLSASANRRRLRTRPMVLNCGLL
jgi:hypothetical protein